MARIVLTVGGYVLGNMLLPGIGGMLGGYVGGMVDQQLFGGTAKQTVYGARMQDLRVQSSSYGSVIPTLYGKGRRERQLGWWRRGRRRANRHAHDLPLLRRCRARGLRGAGDLGIPRLARPHAARSM